MNHISDYQPGGGAGVLYSRPHAQGLASRPSASVSPLSVRTPQRQREAQCIRTGAPKSSSGSKSSDGWYLNRDAARHWNPEDLKLVHLDVVLLEAYLRLLSRLEILLLL